MEIHFKIIGALLILLSLIHVGFPKYFNWDKDLKPLMLINRQMMVTHTFFIALVVFLMGLLCYTSGKELMNTRLGKTILLGLAIFWTIRLILQFFGYSQKLWRGKTFETAMHILFSGLWIYFCFIFWTSYFSKTGCL